MRAIFFFGIVVIGIFSAPLFTFAAYCPTLTQTLSFGAHDSTTSGQVTELQKFLVDYYKLDAGEYVTGYFGRLTRDNVRKFQCEKMEICFGDEATTGYGVVGSKTRAKIAEVCSGGGTTTGTSYSQGAYYSQGSYTSTSYSQSSYNPSPPGVSITINNEESIELDQSVVYNVRWLSSNAARCMLDTLFGLYASTTATVPPNVAGWALGILPQGGVTYTLFCMNQTGTTAKSARATLRPRSPCMVGGTNIPDGQSRKLYSQTSVQSPTTCESVSEVRFCSDGILSGSSTHNKLTCTDQPTGGGGGGGGADGGGGGDGGTASTGSSCTYKGQSYPEGQSVSVPYAYATGASPISLKCDNGTWLTIPPAVNPGQNICDNLYYGYISETEGTSLGCTSPRPTKAYLAATLRHGKAPLTIKVTTSSGTHPLNQACPSYTVYWGDGASDTNKVIDQDGGPGCAHPLTHEFTNSHTYSSPGSYTFSYTANDINGKGLSNSAKIRVD